MSWDNYARCRHADINLFYTNTPTARKEAIAMCNKCHVRAECLADALSQNAETDFGVRGGTTARQRRMMRRQERKMAYTPVAIEWDSGSGKYRRVRA